MDVVLLLLTIIVWVKYILIIAMRPLPSTMSRFELERRAKTSKRAKEELLRERRLGSVFAIQHLVGALMLATGVLLLVVYMGWTGGVVMSVVLIILCTLLKTQSLVLRLADTSYRKLEPVLLRLIDKGEVIFRYVGEGGLIDSGRYRRFDSKDDFINLLNTSKDALTDQQRQIITSTLVFNEKVVSEVMTPRSDIKSIKKDEFLGPLVLSELHDLGHSRLPVIDEDLDHVIGILYLRDLLSLDVKRSVSAKEAMDGKVYYINQDDSLEHALAAFLKVRHHLFVVINDNRETVGLLSLEDVIENMIGQKIIDEDDHTDAASVANTKKNSNNRPAGRIDV